MTMKKSLWFSLIVAGQLAYLGSTVAYHSVRVHTGTSVLLKTVPVDPWSVFRGRYVALNYDMSRLPTNLLKDADPSTLHTDDTVYVVLAKKETFWEPVSVHTHRPRNGIFLRGRLRSHSRGIDELSIDYGMESFFLSEPSADELGKKIRAFSMTSGRRDLPLTIEVSVSRDGTGYPVTLLWESQAYR